MRLLIARPKLIIIVNCNTTVQIFLFILLFILVPVAGLEPASHKASDFKSDVVTYFTTRASFNLLAILSANTLCEMIPAWLLSLAKSKYLK